MFKKGFSSDNAACEGFFGRLKNEMFYGHSWTDVTTKQFIDMLNKYIKWYAKKRIKLSLGGISPLDFTLLDSLLLAMHIPTNKERGHHYGAPSYSDTEDCLLVLC